MTSWDSQNFKERTIPIVRPAPGKATAGAALKTSAPNCFTRVASRLAASGGAVPCCTDSTRAPAIGPATAVASSCWSPVECKCRASSTSPARLNLVADVRAEAESVEGLLNRDLRSSAIAPPSWFATTEGSHDKVPAQGPTPISVQAQDMLLLWHMWDN